MMLTPRVLIGDIQTSSDVHSADPSRLTRNNGASTLQPADLLIILDPSLDASPFPLPQICFSTACNTHAMVPGIVSCHDW